ncbi:hypothetical protein Taro_001090 [Colocasia esculenta]|uniref:Uncharacterized protein n=1 Tax=Colocasia esculenta TaxID=4460 RepID=A0A843TJP3_COLES|nr:hypothetical protein [Colocasia esculenta]
MTRAVREPREDDARSVGVPSARRFWVFFDVFYRVSAQGTPRGRAERKPINTAHEAKPTKPTTLDTARL